MVVHVMMCATSHNAPLDFFPVRTVNESAETAKRAAITVPKWMSGRPPHRMKIWEDWAMGDREGGQ